VVLNFTVCFRVHCARSETFEETCLRLSNLDLLKRLPVKPELSHPSSRLTIYSLSATHPLRSFGERVFPLYDDESLLLAHWVEAKRGERVLEIGTGAGVAALKLAAEGAERVIATDISPRVGDCFAFNAELNGLAGKVEYVNSDVFENLNGERFDIIVSNPPFVPVPGEARYFLHSDGGPSEPQYWNALRSGGGITFCPAGALCDGDEPWQFVRIARFESLSRR